MNDLTQFGVAGLILLSGVMAVVFIMYIRQVLSKIDSVEHIKPLVDRVERLVDKVERIFTTLEVMKQTTTLEIEALKDRVKRLEEKALKGDE